jgi:hypothetical protein
MRITGARLVHALEDKPKSRVQVTIVQLLMGASLMLVASLHLAYPEHEAFSFAEMALWGCFLVDLLWHFGIWKKTMKRVFGGVKGLSKIVSRQNANLKMIEGVKRRQSIMTMLGTLFMGIVLCAAMILANPVLDLFLQDKGNECKKRKSVLPSCFCFFMSYCFGRTHIVVGGDIFSWSEEKAGREAAGYEGGSSSSFARIFVDFVSELRLGVDTLSHLAM